jgi:hypothetical protein
MEPESERPLSPTMLSVRRQLDAERIREEENEKKSSMDIYCPGYDSLGSESVTEPSEDMGCEHMATLTSDHLMALSTLYQESSAGKEEPANGQ